MNIIISLLLGVSYSVGSFILGGDAPVSKEEQLVQLAKLYREEQSAWPGLQWSEAPLIVTFEDGDIFAIGLNESASDWKEVRLQGETLLLAKEDKWNLKREKMHPFFPIGDQEAFVFRMNSPKSVKILTHERFHRFQMDHFEDGDSAGGYKQHLNVENVALMAVEESLLQEFVQLNSLESLNEYIAIHRERVALIDEESLAWEEMQQRLEGLADYVAAKMNGEEKMVLEKINDENLVENAMKWRHYGVGAALGLALDALNVANWKQKVQSGESLGKLLDQAISLTKDQERMLSKKAKKRFKYLSKKKKVAKQIGGYQAVLEDIDAEFASTQGPSLKIGSLQGVGVSGGGRSQAIYYLEDGSQVLVKDESFSGSMDGRWTFETKAPTTLYQRNGYREVKALSEVEITLNDQAFEEEIDCPREYPFSSLSVDSLGVSFKVKEAMGVLVHQGDHLEVRFVSDNS